MRQEPNKTQADSFRAKGRLAAAAAGFGKRLRTYGALLGKMSSDRWERNFAILLLVVFICLGVLFFVYVIPHLGPNFGALVPSRETAATREEEADPAKNYAAGVKLSDGMNYSAALLYFQKAAEKAPDNIDYQNELALTHYRLKNYDEALSVYERLIGMDKAGESSYANRIANIYWIRRQYDRAQEYFLRAIDKDPAASVSYNNLALMLAEEGKQDDAVRVLRDGIKKSADGKELEGTLRIVQGAEK